MTAPASAEATEPKPVVNELPLRLVDVALSQISPGAHDDLLVQGLLKLHGAPDIHALVRHVSQIVARKLQLVAGAVLDKIHAARAVDALSVTPIVWVPRSVFYLAAVRAGADRLVVISNGTLDAINLISQYCLLNMISSNLKDSGISEYTEHETEFRDLMWLFYSIFRSSLGSERVMFLPDVVHEMPEVLQLPAMTLIHMIRLFAILHEIGHLQLGHLGGFRSWRFWQRTRVRIEGAPIHESPNKYKKMEHGADEFALRIAGGEALLTPATLFFQLLGLVDILRGHQGRDHPHALNRIAYLRTRFSLPPDSSSSVDTLLALVQEAGGRVNVQVDLNPELSQYPTAPTEFHQVMAFRRMAGRLYNFVRMYPDLFHEFPVRVG